MNIDIAGLRISISEDCLLAIANFLKLLGVSFITIAFVSKIKINIGIVYVFLKDKIPACLNQTGTIDTGNSIFSTIEIIPLTKPYVNKLNKYFIDTEYQSTNEVK